MPQYVELYNEEIPNYGTLYDIKSWLVRVEQKLFIDYDGFCHPVKDGKMNPHVTIYPSQWKKLPKDATHVVWFNR